MCDGLENIFLLRISEKHGQNWQVQGVLLFRQTQKLDFCVRPWSLLIILNVSVGGPTDTMVF